MTLTPDEAEALVTAIFDIRGESSRDFREQLLADDKDPALLFRIGARLAQRSNNSNPFYDLDPARA